MRHPRRLAARLATVLLMLPGAAAAADPPQVTLSVVETDPEAAATLFANDNVYVHFHYSASAPVRIWVAPFFQGQVAPAMTMGSPLYPAGEGEGFGWFGFRGAARVDSIHLQVAMENSGYPFTQQAFPAQFTWSGAPGAAHERAAWVAPFEQREQARQREAYRQYMNQPVGVRGGIALAVFGVLVLGSLLVCCVWPLWALLRWRGAWRALAALPLTFVALWVIKDIVEISADPTSHNLLPFELIEAAVIVAVSMSILSLVRRRALRAAA
ncbi:MAG TPA: hypothetical protein VMU44_08305 [Steroidobacteraceae bacterium]|nr:hypothetical protein [Steroidobacteraceae bacterium]